MTQETLVIDLHLHTTASDGTLPPQEVVQEAARVGAKTIAFTDHDTMAGVWAALPLAQSLGIELIAGVELNTDARGAEVDVLAYFLYPPPQIFQAMLEARQQDRIRRAKGIVARLKNLGLDISYERVREIARGIVARPHIAQAMIEKGYVSSQQEAYQQYIGFGAPAYVERDELHPAQAISYVREAGGLPVVAHPGLIGSDEIVLELLQAGAAGLEAYYPEHTRADTERYLKLAADWGVIVTAGTDCHGPGRKKSYPIGSLNVPPPVLIDFKAGLAAAWARAEAGQ